MTHVTYRIQHPGFRGTGHRIRTVAERYPRLAVRLAQRFVAICETEPHAAAEAQYTLGFALLCWERPQEARAQFQAALAHAGNDVTQGLRCRLALLETDLIQNPLPELEPDLEALGAECLTADLPDEAARAGLLLVMLLNMQGRPTEATTLSNRIAPLMTNAPLLYGRLLLQRGNTAIIQADYDRAADLLTQAEQHFGSLHLPLDQARCWLRQAWLKLRQEQAELSKAEYLRAEQVFIRYDLPIRRAFCDKAIGFALSRSSRSDTAQTRLIRALAFYNALGHTAEIGACLLNLGALPHEAGEWDLALTCFSLAEKHLAAAKARGELMIARRNRAMVYVEKGQLDQAQALLLELEAEISKVGDPAEQAEIGGQIATVLAESGNLDAAEARYRAAEARYRTLDHTTDAAECVAECGWLALRRGDYAQAEHLLLSAAPELTPLPFYWRVDHGLARCAVARGDLSGALKHYYAAHAAVARIRRQHGSEHASSALYRQAVQMYNEALELAASCDALEDLLVLSEYQRALILQRLLEEPLAPSTPEPTQTDPIAPAHPNESALDTFAAAYIARMLRVQRARSADLGQRVQADTPFDLATFRCALSHRYGQDWSALVYIFTNDQLLILMLTPSQLTLERRPYDTFLRARLDWACLPRYRKWTYTDLPFHQQRTNVPWDLLGLLGELLLPATLRTRLHPDHRLLIVPTGALHLLPWAALRPDGNWLVQCAVIQILSSLTVGLHLTKNHQTDTTAALLVGCRSFGGRAEPLPAVGQELALIEQRRPVHDTLLDAAATRDALRVCLKSKSYALLHIASHAHWFAHSDEPAHIKLWDGDVALSEIAGFGLNGTLVVLLACHGATASVLPGEELLGLSWAWLAAGASGIVASLWQIHDMAALALADAFYGFLNEHNDPGRALAQAQRTLIQGTDANEFVSPLHWSGVTLLGM